MRPGGILKFWQGIVEVLLRGATVVFPLIALVTSAIVLGKIAELDSRVRDALNDNEDIPDGFPPAPDTPNLVTISQGVSSIIILAAIAIILYQIMLLLLRCLGLEVCNKIFIIAVVMDVVVSVGLVLFYIAFGSTAANGVGSWDDWVDYVDTVDTLIPEEVQEALDLDLIEDIRNAVTATAVFCFLSVPVLFIFGIWMIVSFVTKWNEKITAA